MIKAVVFDLDNTLIDFMRLKTRSCEEAVLAMIGAGLDMKKEEALKVLFELYDKYGLEDQKIFQKFLRATIGRIDWKILSSGIVAYRRVKSGYLEPYPRVHSTLINLKVRGIKLAILSDAPKMRAWLRIASMRLTDFFDVVVTHDDTKHFKPHPATFKLVLKRLGLPPQEVLMVGDWPERDILGAKKVGMLTCLASYGCVKPSKRVKPDWSINSIEELINIIESVNDG
ncbi:TIGR02253 family HAD-type hydrolase [Candidatus Woesearchaeota archaeon]|nr:MAG: TIGR02253 family HAD-type hydrolase [Candidatus Woesearchaeota archaeon]